MAYDDEMERYKECELTPTQEAYLSIMLDGQSHAKEEFQQFALSDSGLMGQIPVHMTELRKKLEPLGETVLNVYRYKKYSYQLVICYFNRGRELPKIEIDWDVAIGESVDV